MIDEKKLYVVVSIIVVEEEYINKYTLSFLSEEDCPQNPF